MPRLVILGGMLNMHAFIQDFGPNIHIQEILECFEYSILGKPVNAEGIF